MYYLILIYKVCVFALIKMHLHYFAICIIYGGSAICLDPVAGYFCCCFPFSSLSRTVEACLFDSLGAAVNSVMVQN